MPFSWNWISFLFFAILIIHSVWVSPRSGVLGDEYNIISIKQYLGMGFILKSSSTLSSSFILWSEFWYSTHAVQEITYVHIQWQ